MIKTLLGQVKEYKTAALLAPLFTVSEVLMEVLIPFVTAAIIDKGIEAGNLRQVYLYGGLMLLMACLSLVFGVLAGRFSAKTSSGLACNLRESIYEKVQTFSFSNIDKFSTAGLVTRMTTDVANVQNAAQMILRVAVRAPFMMICIERFPEKYNTWIEQGGSNVSGGQKQRLCIARALLKRPKVLILDDSTSAVDTATDAKIRQAFAKKIPGTTKLIVAQRISSVQDADRILVLDNGRIDGFDTHENLLKTNKIYQEIYEAQTQGGGDFDQPVPAEKEGAQR